MQYLLGHLAVRIHRDDQGACFYPSALAVFIDRAASMTVPRRAAASFNSEHFVGGGTELMVWVGAAVPTGEMRC